MSRRNERRLWVKYSPVSDKPIPREKHGPIITLCRRTPDRTRTHSFTHVFTHSPTHVYTHSMSSHSNSLTPSSTLVFTHSWTHSPEQSSQTVTKHSLTHPLTYPLTYSLISDTPLVLTRSNHFPPCHTNLYTITPSPPPPVLVADWLTRRWLHTGITENKRGESVPSLACMSFIRVPCENLP